jgi:hypothetical protein
VEKCKQRDLLENMLAEMAGEFPALSRVNSFTVWRIQDDFIPHPADFLPHPTDFIPHPADFIPHPANFIPHPADFHPSSG